ncbi:thioredoxin family protein [Pseudothermotoga thermarum]|uniref:Redox-active disulfide protein 2 n=1 Tax=Pseudothermotoga thermarum DSM 5069 TaxID=688269 RepID=F7YV26_9THEM|nr:thioredoxin family protein [Pseudothermotoga thermarum]AEH50312.1 redox-active disulfide protein 2 [Pseudothermotoga thermarum DSM 5069]
MEIKILGKGCAKCKALEANVLEAIKELGVEAKIEKVTDVNKIAEYNVMMTPGLVINNKVKSFGKVATREEIKKFIQEEL